MGLELRCLPSDGRPWLAPRAAQANAHRTLQALAGCAAGPLWGLGVGGALGGSSGAAVSGLVGLAMGRKVIHAPPCIFP